MWQARQIPDRERGPQPRAAIAIACTLLLAMLLPRWALAETEDSARAERELTRTQATALVQKRYAARVVRASSIEEGGRHVYVFKLLSEGGKVWIVRIDARSGAEVP